MTKDRDARTQLAAGCLVWRERGKELEVMLVHRPRYRDWSWPKGKLKAGETLAACALRETAEETGRHVVLGRPLPSLSYTLKGGRPKEVHYWAARRVRHDDDPAARAQGMIERAGTDEIDKVAWVSAIGALRRLTRASDAKPLRALVQAHMDGTLDTTPLVIVRHAQAKPRAAWPGDEASRPLTAAGRQRVAGLVPLLAAHGVTRLVTSPWQRCLDTVQPYARAAGIGAELLAALSEAGAERHPDQLDVLLTTLLAQRRATAICTHRPVLPLLLGPLAAVTCNGLRKQIPAADPYLATAELLVAQIARQPRVKDGQRKPTFRTQVVSLSRVRPPL